MAKKIVPIDMPALESKVLKGKIEIMTKSVFISTILLSVTHIITDAVETAATNGKFIWYNPEFIAPLSIPQMAGLISHECWHIAFQHLPRRGDRNPKVWNFAGDFVINNQQIKNGFELPPGGLVDPKYDDMSTDEIYKLIFDDMKDLPMGGLMDIMGDPLTDEDQAKVKDILVRAQIQAQAAGEAGDLPGEIQRVIKKLINPRVPWPVLLNRFLDRQTYEEHSWARRNRRFNGIYMPGMHSYGLGHLVFGIDTSGSRNDEHHRATLSEIKGIQDTFRPEKMTILDCDTEIRNVHKIDASTDILSLDFTGGGGTRLQPVLDYVTEHPAQALIYFTDLEGEPNLKSVDYPVIWICNSNHSPAPFGQTVYVD